VTWLQCGSHGQCLVNRCSERENIMWLAVHYLFQSSQQSVRLWDSFLKFNLAQSLVTFDVTL
jgi:hypothetical protein